jgi:hypothetical protein
VDHAGRDWLSATIEACPARNTAPLIAACAEVDQFLINCLPLLFQASTAAVRVIAAGQVIDSVAGS